MDLRLASLVAVMLDAKAVSLVAQLLYHPYRLTVLVNVKWHTVAREIYLVKPFCYANGGNCSTQP